MAELFQILAKGSIQNTNPDNTQVFSNAGYTTIEAFDAINVQRGGITCNTTTNAIALADDGLYTLEGGLVADFASNDEIQIKYHVNGVESSGTAWTRQGQGVGNPFSMFWSSIAPLSAGDVIDLRAQNAGAGTLTPNIVRIILTITKDSP